jgi:uncharacterized membrane protein YdjX (TVP38/TMEM64 family)
MKKSLLKLAIFLLIVLAGWITLRVNGVHRLSPEAIQGYVLSFGWWAPFVYILFYTIRPLFLFPAVILSLTGGMTFGPMYGTIYDLIGASLGAYLAFSISRLLGREAMGRWFGSRVSRLGEYVGMNGFASLLILRLIPIVPFDAVNYGAGLTKISFREYALATTIGIIPGAFAYNFLGHSLHRIFSPKFFLAISFVLLLSILPPFYKWVKNRSHQPKDLE